MSLEDKLRKISEADVKQLIHKDVEYGSSWKKRGGTGAFHQALARKWDRLEEAARRFDYDIFAAIMADCREGEGIRDTIGDLRRYLLLLEAEYTGWSKPDGQEHPFGYDGELAP